MPNEAEVQALVAFYNVDTDADRIFGINERTTVADLEARLSAWGTPHVWPHHTLDIPKGSVHATQVTMSWPVVLGPTEYLCMFEAKLPSELGAAFPFVDIRLRRKGHVLAEVKAAAKLLKEQFAGWYGRSMQFTRAGMGGEMWIEPFGTKQSTPDLGLEPSAGLRVRSSPRRR